MSWYFVIGENELGTAQRRMAFKGKTLAAAEAIVANASYPNLGPFNVVELIEVEGCGEKMAETISPEKPLHYTELHPK